MAMPDAPDFTGTMGAEFTPAHIRNVARLKRQPVMFSGAQMGAAGDIGHPVMGSAAVRPAT